MWITSSLRGYIGGVLNVKILTEGVHSGDASGVVPSAFRILNMVLNRLEDNNSGEINRKFCVDIPPNRYAEAHKLPSIIGQDIIKKYPFKGEMQPVSHNILELILNRTWKPQLTITGLSGLPEAPVAGNVMLPEVSAKVSLRMPPTADVKNLVKDL